MEMKKPEMPMPEGKPPLGPPPDWKPPMADISWVKRKFLDIPYGKESPRQCFDLYAMTFLIPVYENMPSKVCAIPTSSDETGTEPTEPSEPTEPTKPSEPENPDTSEDEAKKEATIEKYRNGLAKTKVINLKAEAGRKRVKLTWKKSASGYAVDTYQIYRSVKKSSGYSKIFTSSNPKNCYYINTKGLSPNKTYWYKVRGVRTIYGEKLYTPFTKIKVKTAK